jgi:uncharacterized protein (TIGR03437 family)
MRIQLIVVPFLLCGLAYSQTAISAGGIVNGADFQIGKAITPGSLITIFGTQLAARTAQADSIPLSASLGGVTVTFVTDSRSVTAPMLFVTASQINAQVPWDLIPNNTTATVNVIVNNNGTSSAPSPVTVGAFSPGVFASNGRAIAVNQDGTLAWPAGLIAGLTTHPAKPGDVIIVYATGLGAVDTAVQDGHDSLDKLRNTLVKPQVSIGGISANVLFSGLSPQFVGVNQLNITIPNATAGDNVPIQLQSGGVTSTAVTIAVSQ